jgi:hypothetical protein
MQGRGDMFMRLGQLLGAEKDEESVRGVLESLKNT